jgi:hypothetical protein
MWTGNAARIGTESSDELLAGTTIRIPEEPAR